MRPNAYQVVITLRPIHPCQVEKCCWFFWDL